MKNLRTYSVTFGSFALLFICISNRVSVHSLFLREPRGVGYRFKVNLPILAALRQGEKFDLRTLIDNPDDVQAFWEEWWDGRDLNEISRPETLANDDPILTPTKGKDFAQLLTYEEYFADELTAAIYKNQIPAADNVKLWTTLLVKCQKLTGTLNHTPVQYRACIGWLFRLKNLRTSGNPQLNTHV